MWRIIVGIMIGVPIGIFILALFSLSPRDTEV